MTIVVGPTSVINSPQRCVITHCGIVNITPTPEVSERLVSPSCVNVHNRLQGAHNPFLPEISQFGAPGIFSLCAFSVIRLRLTATAPPGRHLVPQQRDDGDEESGAHNH
jgi:hypothetical protein